MPRLRKIPVEPDQVIEDMSPPTEEVIIELGDDDVSVETTVDLAPKQTPRVEPEAPAAPAADDDAVKRALDAQTRADELQRSLAERDRQLRERDEEISRQRERGDDAEYGAVLSSIATEQSVIEKSEADYAAFAAAGDWASAGKAQREMAVASARLDRWEENKRVFDQRREDAKTNPPQRETREEPQDFESRLRGLKVPPEAQKWLRDHPEFITDAARNQELGGVHLYLEKTKKIKPFTAPYFEALDAEFGFKIEPKIEPKSPEPATQRRSIPVSAPVSRDVPATNGQRQTSTTVTLTPDERAIARTSFTASDMTNDQKERLYAKNKQKLAQERAAGRYPERERA